MSKGLSNLVNKEKIDDHDSSDQSSDFEEMSRRKGSMDSNLTERSSFSPHKKN